MRTRTGRLSTYACDPSSSKCAGRQLWASQSKRGRVLRTQASREGTSRLWSISSPSLERGHCAPGGRSSIVRSQSMQSSAFSGTLLSVKVGHFRLMHNEERSNGANRAAMCSSSEPVPRGFPRLSLGSARARRRDSRCGTHRRGHDAIWHPGLSVAAGGAPSGSASDRGVRRLYRARTSHRGSSPRDSIVEAGQVTWRAS